MAEMNPETPDAWQKRLQWLEDTALATEVRESRWLYPAVETAHILGFVVLVGAAVMFDLRLLGASKRLPVKDIARHLLRWSQASVIIVVPSGIVLFMADAVGTSDNPAFQLKLLLLALAGLNALIFHVWTFRSVDRWNIGTPAPTGAKFGAVASILLWAGVITCGRLIAYM